MTFESVKPIFTFFSGEEVNEINTMLISMAVADTEKMLLPDAERNDVRLSFLAAAMANLHLQQAYAAKIQTESFYEGSLSSSDKKRIISLSYAEKLMEKYLDLCRNLIVPQTFIFMSFGSEGVFDNA